MNPSSIFYSYASLTFCFYLCRWLISGLLMAPVINVFQDDGIWTATMIAQIVGAIVFFPFDTIIFANAKEKT